MFFLLRVIHKIKKRLLYTIHALLRNSNFDVKNYTCHICYNKQDFPNPYTYSKQNFILFKCLIIFYSTSIAVSELCGIYYYKEYMGISHKYCVL